MNKSMRLQKFISNAGAASRRKAEEWISKGFVSVNGEIVTHPVLVDETDEIRVKGKIVKLESELLYFAFNKPQMVVTTMSDQFNRKSVAHYFKDIPQRVYPVGRLDYNSSGLIFITNDGEFANFMMHPKNEVEKTYAVRASGVFTNQMKSTLSSGVDIGGYVTNKAVISKVDNYKKNNEEECIVHITISEGKNRQIRRMFEAVGLKIISLERIAIGSIELNDLKKGRYRSLSVQELSVLGYKL